jgi:hypothetical protein
MTIPAFHHLPDRCWISSSYCVRSSRVRLSISCCTKDTSIRKGCQLVFWGIESGCYGENNYKVTLSHFPVLIRNSDTVRYVPILKNIYFTYLHPCEGIWVGASPFVRPFPRERRRGNMDTRRGTPLPIFPGKVKKSVLFSNMLACGEK